MAKRKSQPQHLWISPNAADAVKIFETTLGRFPNYNLNLRLVNGLPFVQMNPLLSQIDIVNMISFPFFSTFVVALVLQVLRFRILSPMQLVQLMAIITGLVIFAFLSFVRHGLRRNCELVHQWNSFFQSNPTSKYHKSHQPLNYGRRYNDVSGLMLLFLIIAENAICLPSSIIISYLGLGPIQMTAEQIFNLHSNKFLIVLDIVFIFITLMFVLCREGFIIAFGAVTLFSRIDAELVSLHSYSLEHTEFVRSRFKLLQCRYRRIGEDISILTGSGILLSQVII